MNDRITKKERGLIKGALNRVFSRSELRNKVKNAGIIEHYDPKRPRVTKWVRCASCKEPLAGYQADIDHIQPKIPVYASFDDMSIDVYLDKLWCAESNLQILCFSCHKTKSRLETKERARLKREKKGKNE